MHTRKRMPCNADNTCISNVIPLRTLLLIWTMIVIMSSSKCDAQCSIPPATFIASTRPLSIYSPNHPNAYPDDTSCSWLINSPIDAGRIELRVVQNLFSCCCNQDYLLIKDGTNSSSRSIAILCSEVNPVTITSSGPSLFGEFRSNGDGNGLGYTLQFSYYDSEVSCPPDWIERNGNCYKLYTEELPWQQAASRCGYDGGFLTSIADQEENDFLVGSFQGLTPLAWIGMDSTGSWLDSSNSQFYNNFLGESTSTTQCSAIDLNDNGRWTVVDCTNQQLTFICKKTKDGSGGRYWTEVVIEGGGGQSLSTGSIVALVIFPSFFLWMICCSGRDRDNWLITRLVSTCCDRTCSCIRAISRGVGYCLSCKCFRSAPSQDESNHARRGSTSLNSSERHRTVSLDDMGRSRSSLSSSGNRSRSVSFVSTASQEQPPSYGDATSEPPPPSYTEALDPAFNFSNGDTRSSRTSLNISQPIPAPSYESIHGFDSHI